MPLQKNKKLTFYIFMIVFLAGLAFLFFNEFGFLKYWRLEAELDDIKNEIISVEEENKMLEEENDSLKNKIPAKIEKTAREKYGMSKKGEQVIEVLEEDE
jgi:cell division protein FtsB